MTAADRDDARARRLLDGHPDSTDRHSNTLRPLVLQEFVGQQALRENLRVFIDAARVRREPLDHVLFSGPPGLGKTTLAQIVAREMQVGFRMTSGPTIARGGDLAALLTNLEPRDVLFIDEIHRLNPAIEEVLYPAMEDFQLDLIIGEGPAARSLRIDLPPFTLIAATTRSGLLTAPLRERFGIPLRLQFYTDDELQQILLRSAAMLAMPLADDGAGEIARRSRGTPRVAGRLLRRVRDYTSVAGVGHIDAAAADSALNRLDVDGMGLDHMDRRYLACIAETHSGGPVGADTLAASLSEHRDVIEEVIEPFLMQQGLVGRTPRGRVLLAAGYRHLGLPPLQADSDLLSPLYGADHDESARRIRKVTSPAPTGSRFGSTTRTPMPAASSITPAIFDTPNGPHRDAARRRHHAECAPGP